jgi:cytochrome b involved in lipid metabolism
MDESVKVSINGQWYDLTNFKHPGGDVIRKANGKEMTLDEFKRIHKQDFHSEYFTKYLVNDNWF